MMPAFGEPRHTHFHFPRAAMRAGTFDGPPGAVRTAARISFRPRRVVRAAGASTLASAADLRPGANS